MIPEKKNLRNLVTLLLETRCFVNSIRKLGLNSFDLSGPNSESHHKQQHNMNTEKLHFLILLQSIFVNIALPVFKLKFIYNQI